MIATLEFMKAELALQTSTLTMHLRNRAYKLGTPAHQNALQSLLFYVMIGDELGILLERYGRLKNTLRAYQAGDWVAPFEEEDEADIYQYCLHDFEGDHCPLGSATNELQSWMAAHIDRNRIMREGFEMLFPDVKFRILDESTDLDPIDRELTEAKAFEQQTSALLREIEASNALTEFNEHVLQVRTMLLQKESVSTIIQSFPVGDE